MSALRGSSTGVFVGQMTDDYYDIVNKDVHCAPQYTATGTSRATVANRVSYFFDCHGPSVNMDTACSSSLVALLQAVQALRNQEVGLAVAAGVNLILGPEKYIYESQLSMLSPMGRSRMWDADADGQALADNDHVECIIRETGVNQDGRSDGLTLPSSLAQTALIHDTYARCGLDATKSEDRCQYFEAHGTGTQAGDPREAQAIRDAFFPQGSSDPDRDASDRLYVGSVKTVVGHLEGAAGLAGLLKASLAIRHAQIPPIYTSTALAPRLRPFTTTSRCPRASNLGRAWTRADLAEPASIPLVLEGQMRTPSSRAWILPTKIQTMTQLDRSSSPLPRQTGSGEPCWPCPVLSNLIPPIRLRDLAWTLQSRRQHFPVRLAVAASHRQQLIERLDEAATSADSLALQASTATRVTKGFPARILGIFTGQGAQWPRMGAELLQTSAQFRESIGGLQASLEQLPDGPRWSLADELLETAETSRIGSAATAQPICTAVQVALVDLLRAAHVEFHAVVGHSSGEIAAAYAAGSITARDAIRIILVYRLYRGRKSD